MEDNGHWHDLSTGYANVRYPVFSATVEAGLPVASALQLLRLTGGKPPAAGHGTPLSHAAETRLPPHENVVKT